MKKNKIDSNVIANEISASLVANINHSLRTPLNGIVGVMDLLSKTGLDENQLKYSRIIREATESLMLQLDNILELAKYENEEMLVKNEVVRLRDVIKEALQSVLVLADKKRMMLSVDYGYGLPEFIETDKRKLLLALTNLLACSLRLSDRGKVVLKVFTEEIDEEDNTHTVLRFKMENSKILYDALYGAFCQYDEGDVDIREFGEVTVGLLTTRRVLQALGAKISFDHFHEGHEPPFHFDIDYDDTLDGKDVPSTCYSVLSGKRAIIMQDDILETNLVTQALRLWGVDVHILSEPKHLMEEINSAYKEGRGIDILFVSVEVDRKILSTAKQKVPHVIIMEAGDSYSPAWLSEFSAHLIPPVYPDELYSVLTGLYLEVERRKEGSFVEEASSLVSVERFAPIGNGAKILVVEDDTTSRFFASEMLAGLGCDVVTAEDGQQALIKLSRNDFSYDIVFMDCMMPRMDGYKTATVIREEYGRKDLPIIALTANTMERDREKCLDAGMDDYIPKPVREQDLHDMLEKYLKR